MKPVKLKFKGINSFSEQTEIDFEKLTANGIFGIFGDTGSGKSTILDCINFALYGKVERSKEKLDIINYRSEAAEVYFEFDVLTEGKRKKYITERSLKKKSGVHKAALYEDGKCIADNASTVTKKITDILGVDAEDFRKCIALPQGEFSQFVKSQPSERIALIERLFSLYKYGDRLKERLKARETQAEMTFQTLSAKVSMFVDISDENVKNFEIQTENCKKQIQSITADCSKAEKEFNDLKSLGEKRAELDEIEIKLKELESAKTQMEELRAGLKAVPVCKTAVETNGEIINNKVKLNEIERSLSEIDGKTEILKEKMNKLALRSENENYDERIAHCITLSAKYSACEGKPEKLADIGKKLDNMRSEFRAKSEERMRLQSKLAQAEEEVKLVEKSLADCGIKSLDRLINVTFKGAVLKEEYVNSLDYFAGLNGQIKFYKDDSELYKFIVRELKQQIENYKDRVYQVKDFNLSDAQTQLRNIQVIDERREKLTAQLNEKNAALSAAQTAFNDCVKEINILQRDGEELRKQSDEIKAELEKAFGQINGSYIAAEKANEETLAKLKNQKNQLTVDIETIKKELAELNAKLAAKKSEKNSVCSEIKKLEEKLKLTLSQSGFADIENCKKLVYEFSKFSDAEKALEEYDAKLISVRARKIQLEKVEGIKNFSQQALKDAESIKNSLSSDLSQTREMLAVLESDIKKAKSRLTEKKALQKELSTAEKERNLIAQLKEVTKGNRFMEYIANEYLYDISRLASSTLLNLTDGRYFLTYKDTFYAGDNFNCGNLRGVNTLSGGETFLVSLSLALALSQTICASLKSIEFFFLDEGFGTLDSTLVDTVMNALEKLKGAHFTIGVISHVEELKNRIDNKITVYKATETHGSTVRTSC